MEETKVGDLRRSEENKSESIKKLSDIPSTESVMVTNKKTSDRDRETPGGDEDTSCVLCFDKQIEMLLPCYVNPILSSKLFIVFCILIAWVLRKMLS